MDMLLSDHAAAEPRSDQDYADLLHVYLASVNFTRRLSGIRIATGRSFEVPLCGGVLLEEDSIDTAYFMAPGEHYVPFDNLAELSAALIALLGDPDRRSQIAVSGHDWVHRYFTGDQFWAGLLKRLYD